MSRFAKVFALVVAVGLSLSLTAQETPEPAVSIVRIDPAFDKLVPKDAVLEKIANGFTWSEGPAWNRKEGYLLFSDVPQNTVFKWQQGKGTSVYLKPSGYNGAELFTGREPGSNGLAYDSTGHLILNQHGNRRIARQEADGKFTALAESYDGKRLNSPNDLAFRKNGDLYFTDPPYGLPKTFDDPQKMPYQGVYRLSPDGKLTLLEKDIKAPNGIAFSPDQKTLYVDDSDKAQWWAFDVKDDGTLANKRLFYDASAMQKDHPGTADGMKVDAHGNIFTAGPGGILVISPEGKLLGRFDLGVPTGNCAWGEDGSTLFIAGNHNVFRIKLSTKGAGF